MSCNSQSHLIIIATIILLCAALIASSTQTIREDAQPDPKEFCDKTNSTMDGFCRIYRKCNRTTEEWETHRCPSNPQPRFWQRSPLGDKIPGGECRLWGDLNEETRMEYRISPACFRDTYFEKISECSYRFNVVRELYDSLTIREQVVCGSGAENIFDNYNFDSTRELCDHCSNVINEETGQPCC